MVSWSAARPLEYFYGERNEIGEKNVFGFVLTFLRNKSLRAGEPPAVVRQTAYSFSQESDLTRQTC
jgi:hypothetical protein